MGVRSWNFYEHGPRAGNRGDVWKHFLLLTTLELLTTRGELHPGPFRYLETHCGQALHLLGKTGAWREGVGRLQPPPAPLAGHPYFKLLGLVGGAGGVYPGSWVQVALYLQARGLEFRMRLYDASPRVQRHMMELGASASPQAAIRFLPGDGFSGLKGSKETWDLALVDPPFWPDPERDHNECSKAMGILEGSCRTFLIWYPLFSERDPGLRVGAGRQALEIAWGEDETASSMAGCGVLLGGKEARIPQELFPCLELLALRLGAGFRCKGSERA